MSLSFSAGDKSQPIALVKNGNEDGKVLYLHEGQTKGEKKAINKLKYSKMLKMKPLEKTKTFIKLEQALKNDVPVDKLVESDEVKHVYSEILKDCTSNKSVELDDEGMFEIIPTPDPTKREVFYIVGQSGSGKSYVAKGIASYYHKLYPKRNIYLISKLEQDDTLDALEYIKRIPIQSFIDDFPDLEEFKECLTIFDDFDTLTGEAEKVVRKVINDLLALGRHQTASMCVLSHFLSNYSKTRLILNEMTHCVVYPLSTSFHALKYLLKNYCGVDEEDLKRYRKFGSRWIMIKKGFPSLMLAQKNAEVLFV